jgi:hypothetical protein
VGCQRMLKAVFGNVCELRRNRELVGYAPAGVGLKLRWILFPAVSHDVRRSSHLRLQQICDHHKTPSVIASFRWCG